MGGAMLYDIDDLDGFHEVEEDEGNGLPADDSPELLRLKAEAIVDYVRGYALEVPHLRWLVRVAEFEYRLRPDQESRWFLEERVRDLVAAEVAMAHIDEVAVEIAAGVGYDRGEQREFEARFLERLRESEVRIQDSKPKQMTLGW